MAEILARAQLAHEAQGKAGVEVVAFTGRALSSPP